MSSAAVTRPGRLWVLFQMQLARVRTAWRPYLIVSSAMPLGIAVLLRAVMEPSQARELGTQVVAGCAVLAISMTAVVMLAQRVSWMKETGALDYYSTLPVSRPALITAILASFALFALPGTLLVVWLGGALFDLSAVALWTAVPVWALGSFALAGFGVALGMIAPDEQLAGMYSNLAMMAILFLGILPVDRIPSWLEPLRAILPSTYAVNALRPGFEGAIGGAQAWDLMVLAGFGALSFWAVTGPLWPKRE